MIMSPTIACSLSVWNENCISMLTHNHHICGLSLPTLPVSVERRVCVAVLLSLDQVNDF
jgi:hypothetical protein